MFRGFVLVLVVSCSKPSDKVEPAAIVTPASTELAVGDFVVWQGQGLVRITAREHGNWIVKAADGMTMKLPFDANVLRRPVARSEADRLASILRRQTGVSDDRPWAVRLHENMVTLIKRPLADQVNALHTLYRSRYALSLGERRLIDKIERVVVGELAHVLGKSDMIAELRAGHPAFVSTEARPPDPVIAPPKAPVVIENHTYLGAFTSPSGDIVVGELTSATPFAARGKAGTWHAYVRGVTDRDEGGLVLIHADALGQHAALLAGLVTLADLNVEGGTMAMVSAEVRSDETFREAAMFPVSPIVEGRGCIVTTDGDGAHRLRGAKIDDRFAALVVDF